MAYPDELVYDYFADALARDYGLFGAGQVMYDIADDSDETTTFRMSEWPYNRTVYIKIDSEQIW